MYNLGNALEQGYLAHTVMQQSFSRAEEALDGLDLSVFSENTSDAAILSNLLQGETAAENRIVYQANSAISLMQTFRQGANLIAYALEKMAGIAGVAATGVYSELEVTAMQDQFNDLGSLINRVAKETAHGPYRLLGKDEKDVALAIGTGLSISLDRVDLSIDAESLRLEQDARAVIGTVMAFQQTALGYQGYLSAEIGKMEQQVAMADYGLTRAMGYGMHIPNEAFALEVVKDVVAAVTADSIVALQAQGRPSSMTLMLSKSLGSLPVGGATS
jgi:hypothetical protein